MGTRRHRTATILAATGSGLVGGIFFAFSTFIMRALGRLESPSAVAAMQAINRAAPTPLFMVPLFGTGLVSLRLGSQAMRRLDQRDARYELAGAAFYLISVILTVVYHVPRNQALDRVAPQSPTVTADWDRYLSSWTAANHIRTASSLAAAIAFTRALAVSESGSTRRGS